MGKKGKWFSAVKRVFSPECKGKKSKKSKKKWFEESKPSDPPLTDSLANSDPNAPILAPPTPPKLLAPPTPPKPPIPAEIKLADAENEQSKHAYSVALAAAVAAEAAVVASQAAAEVVRLTSSTRFSGKSRDETAAIKIQTAFRGYLARRALRALRGLVRLKSLVQGNAVKRQTANTLHCMQTLARVQSQIRSRRIRMTEENQAFQRQMQLKCERELEKSRMGEEWDDSVQSKEKVEANLLNKQEAAIRRERALAYAFSHQWKSSSRSANPMFMDPNNPQWGWSWLERWMAARPWESRSMMDKELNSDPASVKSASRSIGGDIMKAYARRDANSDKLSPSTHKTSRPPSRQSPSTPPSKASSVVGRTMLASPGGCWGPLEDDSRSMVSMQSERHRRHSIAGSSIRDDESLASSPTVPSYMAPTKSAKAKSRLRSPLTDSFETPDRSPLGSVKKQLVFPPSPARVRRHSGPPKVDIAPLKEQVA